MTEQIIEVGFYRSNRTPERVFDWMIRQLIG